METLECTHKELLITCVLSAWRDPKRKFSESLNRLFKLQIICTLGVLPSIVGDTTAVVHFV